MAGLESARMFMDGNSGGYPDVFCYDCGNYKETSQHELKCLDKRASGKTCSISEYADYHNISCSRTPEKSETVAVDALNPKDLLGDKKVDVSQVSPFAIAHEACAMMDGSMKYGFRNWRDKKVRARIYIAACKRHLHAWEEGEETAGDSKVHHLGHARACLGILLDAQETGNLHDDRVKSNGALGRLMDRLGDWVVQRKQKASAS